MAVPRSSDGCLDSLENDCRDHILIWQLVEARDRLCTPVLSGFLITNVSYGPIEPASILCCGSA